MDKNNFLENAPAVEDLSLVFDFSIQHRNRVVREMHQRWPDLWGKPPEVGEEAFYQNLVASFLADPAATREALGAIIERKHSENWRRVLYLPWRAWFTGRHRLRLLDVDRLDEMREQLAERPLSESLRALSEALASLGRPELARVVDWLFACYPTLISTEEDALTGPLEAAGSAPEPTAQTAVAEWSSSIERMRSALEEAAAHPLRNEHLGTLAAALEELGWLADAHKMHLERQSAEAGARVGRALDSGRECFRISADARAEPWDSAGERLASSLSPLKVDLLVNLAERMEERIALVHAALKRREALKQAVQQALGMDDSDRAMSLVVELKAEQAFVDEAKDAVADMLRGFLDSYGDGIGDATATGGVSEDIPDDSCHTVDDQACHRAEDVPEAAQEDLFVDGEDDRSRAESVEGLPSNGGILPTAPAGLPANDETNARPAGYRTSGTPPAASAPSSAGIASARLDPKPITPPASPPTMAPAVCVLGKHDQAPTIQRRLSSELADYEAFCELRWIAPNGRCEGAPWTHDDFNRRLRDAAALALGKQEWAHLEVFCRALEAREHAPLIAGDDVQAVVQILMQPASDAAGASDESRLPRILGAVGRGFPREYVLLATLLELEPFAL